jgi:hypothetical protein
MAKKRSEESSVYRFMCIRSNNSNYHVDFASKNEALNYIEELNDSKIEWYGVYEISNNCNYLKPVVSKRLIPFNDRVDLKLLKEKVSDNKRVRKRRSK